MNIQELQQERDALQKRLRVKIQEELDLFVSMTGIQVDSVSTSFCSVLRIGKPKREYFVSEVNVNLDF